MENPPRFVQEHPLRHLGRCLTQNTEFLQVVQVAQERRKAVPEAEWDLDLSSLDIFGLFVEDRAAASAKNTSTTRNSSDRSDRGLPIQPSQDAVEHLRLFQGLWRLLEQQDLPRAMESLLQVVQYAGQQRYSLHLLQREVESLLHEADSKIFAEPWAVCLEAKKDRRVAEASERLGLSSACSTTSTAGPSSADFHSSYAPYQDATNSCVSDSELSGTEGREECQVSTAAGEEEAFDPQDLDAWELQFLCVAAAEDLWRALRSQDLKGAMEVVISLREEILQAPPSPMGTK